MRFETVKTIVDNQEEEAYVEEDIVTIKYRDGGECGGCTITEITDKGFHFTQGGGQDKSVQYDNIVDIYMM